MKKSFTVFATLAIALLTALNACKQDNQAPFIHSITFDPYTTSSNRVPTGTTVQLTVDASDPDQDPITYSWTASGGEFTTDIDKHTAVWKAPAYESIKNYTIEIAVSDGQLTTSKVITIHVDEVHFGTLEGHIFFNKTTIPVPGVLVSVSDKTAVSDSQGFFQINEGIATGIHTFTATKEGFYSHTKTINLEAGENNVTIRMDSHVHTSSVYGYVTSAESNTPVAFCEVVVLNPDGTESNLGAIASREGQYQIRFVPQGNRTIRFMHDEYEPLETTISIENDDYELNVSLP